MGDCCFHILFCLFLEREMEVEEEKLGYKWERVWGSNFRRRRDRRLKATRFDTFFTGLTWQRQWPEKNGKKEKKLVVLILLQFSQALSFNYPWWWWSRYFNAFILTRISIFGQHEIIMYAKKLFIGSKNSLSTIKIFLK